MVKPINFVDAVVGSFLEYELKYFAGNGLRMLANKPKYTTDLSFEAAFIDDEQIFRDSFDSLYQDEKTGQKKLKNWVAMCWNRSAIVPNTTRCNQRWKQVFYTGADGRQKQATVRLVDNELFISLYANTFDILALVEQRNIVDRGHDVPVELEINNSLIAKMSINAAYPWNNEVTKLEKDKYGGLVSVKYAVKLTFPVISAVEEDVLMRKLVVKLGIGSQIIRVFEGG